MKVQAQSKGVGGNWFLGLGPKLANMRMPRAMSSQSIHGQNLPHDLHHAMWRLSFQKRCRKSNMMKCNANNLACQHAMQMIPKWLHHFFIVLSIRIFIFEIEFKMKQHEERGSNYRQLDPSLTHMQKFEKAESKLDWELIES